MSSTNQRPKLQGVIPAIVTPMDKDGRIDFKRLEQQARYLADAGVDGFFVGGTTGEGAYLSTEEKREALAVVREVSAGRQFLCAACIRPSTSDVLREMELIGKEAPEFIVAVTPYYGSMRQQDLLAHFRTIAEHASSPLIIYNIPGRTHNSLELETVLELARHENIAGIKDSSGDFVQFSRGVLGESPSGFAWIQGEDYLDGPSLMIGCDGIVTGLGNARIEPYPQIYQAAREENWHEVRRLQARINRLYAIVRLCGNSVAAANAAAELSGRGSRWLRHTSQTLTDQEMDQVTEILRRFDEEK